MGDGFGIVFGIGADTSEANASVDALASRTAGAFNKIGSSVEGANRSLGRMGAGIPALRWSTRQLGDDVGYSMERAHEGARLLEVMLGLRLPRAVSTAVGTMIPKLGEFMTYFLAAFAVEKLVEFGVGLRDLDNEFGGLAESQKLMAQYASDNESALERLARTSEQVANQETRQLAAQVAAQSALVEGLKQRAENVANFVGRFGEWWDKYAGKTKEMTDAQEYLNYLQGLYGKLAAITVEDKDRDAKKSAQIAEEERRRYQAAVQRQLEGNVKLNEMLQKQREGQEESLQRTIADQQFRNKLDWEYLGTIDDLAGGFQRNAAQAHQLGVTIAATFKTDGAVKMNAALAEMAQRLHDQHREAVDAALPAIRKINLEYDRTIASARKEAEEVHQAFLKKKASADEYREALVQLKEVEDAAAQARQDQIKAENQNIAASWAGVGAGLAGLIAGRRAQAGVESIFEVAQGIKQLAMALDPYDPFRAQHALSAAQHFLAAAEYGKIAGTGSHHGGAGGHGAGGGGSGGGSSSRDTGGGGGYSGGANRGLRTPPSTLAPGAAGGRFGSPGSGIIVVHGSTDLHQFVAGLVNGAVSRGINVTATNSQRGAPVGH